MEVHYFVIVPVELILLAKADSSSLDISPSLTATAPRVKLTYAVQKKDTMWRKGILI
jgi:hypothetical protein